MYPKVDGKRIGSAAAGNMQQQLDMHHLNFTSTFHYGDKAAVSYTYYSLRQLPFTVLMVVTITTKKDITITSASAMEAPDAVKEV